MKIAYESMSENYQAPGDRRRFYGFAKKCSLNFTKFNSQKKYDYIVLTQNADLTYWLNYEKKDTKIIFDITDDYLEEKDNFRKIFRGIYKFLIRKNKFLNINHKNLLIKIFKKADIIICSTQNLKNKIKKYNKNVHIIYDIFGDDIVIKKKKFNNKDNLKLVWEGYPGNLFNFKILDKVLFKINEKINIQLSILTNKNYKPFYKSPIILSTHRKARKIFKYFKNYKIIEWNRKNLQLILPDADIAIIPIKNCKEGMSAYKPPNKLHFFWLNQIVTLVSPNYEMKRAINKTGLDLICKNSKDWETKLLNLYYNKKQLNNISKRLFNFIKKNNSDNLQISKWKKIFL